MEDNVKYTLARLFLNGEDPDEAYLKVSNIVSRLNDRGIGVNMYEVQEEAYDCKEIKNV